jgi:hypothetical protein
MTSDGISGEDWDMVHTLALAVVNAATDAEDQQARRALFEYLRHLKTRYGDKPSILATEADFVEVASHSEELLLRAFELAEALSDTPNLMEISLSLASLYTTQVIDRVHARYWLDEARKRVDPNDLSQWEEYRSIEARLAGIEDD